MSKIRVCKLGGHWVVLVPRHPARRWRTWDQALRDAQRIAAGVL